MFLFSKSFVFGQCEVWRGFRSLPQYVALVFVSIVASGSDTFKEIKSDRKCGTLDCTPPNDDRHNYILRWWISNEYIMFKRIACVILFVGVAHCSCLQKHWSNDKYFQWFQFYSLARNRKTHTLSSCSVLRCMNYSFATGKCVCVCEDFLLLFHHFSMSYWKLFLLSVDVCILSRLVESTPPTCWFHIKKKTTE